MAKKKTGRPPKTYEEYCKPHLEKIKEMKLGNYTDLEIYKWLGIGKDLAGRFKNKHEDFRKAFHEGKQALLCKLENTMYRRGEGYFIEEEEEVIEIRDGKKYVKKIKRKRWHSSDKCLVESVKKLDRETGQNAWIEKTEQKVEFTGNLKSKVSYEDLSEEELILEAEKLGINEEEILKLLTKEGDE